MGVGPRHGVKVGDLAALRRAVDRRRNASAFDDELLASVRASLRAVRRRGDGAVLRSVRRFDRRAATAADLWVDGAGLRRAARSCPRELARALDLANANLRAFHRLQRPKEIAHRGRGLRATLTPEPLRRVGGCVPRGTVGYPSTALMIGVPARIAGVQELVLASPMPADGAVDPVLAYAATLVGAKGLYRAGGAAAVAAMAYGTASLARVDKIVGPGNAFTTAAKWLVSAEVGIDGLQGPSELVVIASADADPTAIVLDLEAQAEHGTDAFAALVSDSARLLEVVGAVVGRVGSRRGSIGLYRAPSLAAALDAVTYAAPEHVNLAGRAAVALAPRTRNAGAVFVGGSTPVALGDYVAGTNHVLPTGGSARWGSALRVEDFVRWTARVRASRDLGRLAKAGAAVARYEGMDFHAASMELRA
ncbi:MAG: histidinol dehydrogenase [Chloroflexota bacterium]|nr:histidinol dehydrogenase [Chloroflexota bacterium]